MNLVADKETKIQSFSTFLFEFELGISFLILGGDRMMLVITSMGLMVIIILMIAVVRNRIRIVVVCVVCVRNIVLRAIKIDNRLAILILMMLLLLLNAVI